MEKSERLQHIEYWRQSGQSKKEYCALAGIKYPTFMSWLKKSKEAQQPGRFIKLEKKATAHRHEIVFPNGIRLYSSTALTADLIESLQNV